MQNRVLLPEIMVFAGPNGSGKSTITKMAKTVGIYINADDIKRTSLCTDMEAALRAEQLREKALHDKLDFTFETVMSTDRNLNLLKRAKDAGYFIRCIYVLTDDPSINILRVQSREDLGGHGVPEDKIRSRYDKSLGFLPELIRTCDIVHVYDNTDEPFRIFKKRKDAYFYWPNEYWSKDQIEQLTQITF